MKLLWNKEVNIENLWANGCFGLFAKCKNNVTYYFDHSLCLFSISDEETAPHLVHSLNRGERFENSSGWMVLEHAEDSFLLISDRWGIDLNRNVFSDNIPDQLRVAFHQLHRPPEYYAEAPQQLGEYTVIHKGYCGYTCIKDDVKIWDFVGKGYLFTDMMRWNDRLFFGTAGNGGYLYVLDINNGQPLAAIKTGGTRCIIHADNLCYVLRNQPKAQLLCIDLSDGRIVSLCDLPGTAMDSSRIAMIDNHIHAITFNFSHDRAIGFTWSCIHKTRDGLREP